MKTITRGQISYVKSLEGFKSTVFTRSNSRPGTPTGGSYDDPLPYPRTQTSSGVTVTWSDGIPSGTAQIWASSRTFYSDETSSDVAWTTPQPMSDTETLDVEFSASTTEPSAPTGSTPYADHESEGWYDPNSPNFPDSDTIIWRAERKVKNGVFDGDWVISRIKGEKGDTGDDSIFISFNPSPYIVTDEWPVQENPETGDEVALPDTLSQMYIKKGETDITFLLKGTLPDAYTQEHEPVWPAGYPIHVEILGAYHADGTPNSNIHFDYSCVETTYQSLGKRYEHFFQMTQMDSDSVEGYVELKIAVDATVEGQAIDYTETVKLFFNIIRLAETAEDILSDERLLFVDPEEGEDVTIDDPGVTGTVLWGAESANQVALSVNGVSKLLVKYGAIEGLYSSIGVLNGYFSGGAARNALALEGHGASYFATASDVEALVTGVSSVAGQTGAVTVAQIAESLTGAGYKLTDTVYTLPTAGSDALGGIKIGYSASGKNYAVVLDGNDKAYVNVPWTDTIYTLPIASASTLGGMKIGTGLTIDGNGVVSVTGQTQGTVTGVKRSGDSNPYTPDANGIVTIPAYPTSLASPYALTFGNKSYNGGTAVSLSASDLGALTSVAFSDLTAHPTTIADYGITDAKFGTAGSDYVPITLGSTINVLTAHQSLSLYATKQYVDNAIEALPEPMIFKGSLGTGGTITTLPAASASNEGFTYKVITAGTYASQTAKVGDTFISTGTEWVLIPSGDEPSGTVTSVGMTVPTGLSVSGSPITSSGTLAVTFASGYSIPTTIKQSNWDTAYGWGNHADEGYLKDYTIYALTIKNSAGTSVLSYNPKTAAGELTLTKAMVGLGDVDNVSINSWAGSSNITTLGTITTGEWNGTPIAYNYLADAVQNSLDLADTAYQKPSTGIPNNHLTNSSITIGSTSISLGATAATIAGLTKLTSQAFSLGGYVDANNTTESTLTWDATNKAWKITGNLYATGWISQSGVSGTGGGGGGSSVTVLPYSQIGSYSGADTDLTTVFNAYTIKQLYTNKYQKPGTGIPLQDLASSIQTSLGKADSAYQKPSGGIPKSDLSADLYMWLLYSSGDSYALLPSEVGTSSPICVNVTGTDEVYISGLGGYDGDTDNIDSSSSVQTVINGKYVKPSGGIPATDLASAVQTSLGKADNAYQKPSGGIPNSDLALDMSWEYVGDSATYDSEDYIHVNS